MSIGCIDVVIVHWNQPDSCIDTARRFDALSEVRRVLVVDNGSSPHDLRTLRESLTELSVELIEVGHNSGYGPGVNRGLERWLADPKGTDWVAVAPHDAYPVDGTMTRLLDATSERSAAGNAFGMLSADVGDDAAPFVDHVFGPITRPATTTDGIEEVDYPHGTLFLASRECLGEIGLFDERFFTYCEEADLGLRAQAGGFAVGLVRGARVINPQVNTPRPLAEYLQQRNTVLLIAKHFGNRKAAMRLGLAAWQLARGLVQPTSRGPYWSPSARLRAIVDVFGRRWGTPPASLVSRAVEGRQSRASR